MLKQFSKNVSIYGLAPAFAKFIGFFLVPIYTRVFIPEEYGIIDLFNTVIHLFTVLINLQIYSAVGRYFEKTENKKLLVSTGLWNEIFLSFLIVTPLILFSTNINHVLLKDTSYTHVFVLALLWIPFSVLSTYFAVVMRFENKPLLFLKIAVIQTITKVTVSLSAILIFNSGIAGIYIGHISGDLIALCLFLFYLRKYIGFKLNLSLLKTLLIFSLPLVPATFALYASDFINRFIMLKYLSLSAIGIFAVALKVASAFELFSMALRMAWEPFIYAHLDREDHKKQFVRIFKMITIVLCLVVCAITIFSNEILLIISTEKYFTAASIIGLLSINAALKISLEMVGIGPKIVHKTIYDSMSRVSGVIISIGAMFLLIPVFGIMGVAIALCIGSGASLAIGWRYTEQFYPIGYPKLFSLSALVLMVLTVIATNFYVIPTGIKAVAAFTILLLLVYYKDKIRSVIDSVPAS